MMNIWQSIYGHEQIKQDLQLLLQMKKLPHALLFSGIDGIGKLLMAKAVAKSLLCQNAQLNNIACNQCISCRMFDEANHPDYYFVEPESKTKKLIKIEQIRTMQAQIALSPYLSDKKVVIINDAQYLNDTAGNSLLKTLEEPVGEVFFILITANKEMILPTILSRCMKIYFAPMKVDDVTKVLVQNLSIDNSTAQIMARLSGGSVKMAMQFMDNDALLLRDKAIKCLEQNLTVPKIWSFIEELVALDRVQVSEIISHLQMLLRDLLLIKVNQNSELICNQDIRAQLIDIQAKYNVGDLIAKLNLVEDILKRLNSNADMKLILQKFILEWKNRD